MATATLTIKNGRIVDFRDPYHYSISEDGKEYCGNGWVVTIKDGDNNRPGRLICHSERVYSDGPATCHREFKLADGIIGLSGGNVLSRYAYFRGEAFVAWLEDHEIQCVKHGDPNRAYSSSNPVSGYWSHSLVIETDGEVTTSYEEGWGRMYRVKGASYAVVRQRYCDGAMWHLDQGIMYTEIKDVMTINNHLFSKKGEEEKKRQAEKLVAANILLKERLEKVLAPYQGEDCYPSLAAVAAIESETNSWSLPTVRDKEFEWAGWSYGSGRYHGRCLFYGKDAPYEKNGELAAARRHDYRKNEGIAATINAANPKTIGEVFGIIAEHQEWTEDISVRKTFYRVAISDNGLKVRVEYVRTFMDAGDEWIWRQFKECVDPSDTLRLLWEGEAEV